MSLKTEMEQFKININGIMSNYTKDILKYIDVTKHIQKYIDNYTIGMLSTHTIKIDITDMELIRLINDINDINIIKTTKHFDFCSFRYRTTKTVFLIKENLEQYIEHFMPYWNEHIIDHYIVVDDNKHQKASYHLKLKYPIAINFNMNNTEIITPAHNDHMNNLYYNYFKTQLDETIKYIIDEINMTLKNNIVLKQENTINIMEYLTEQYTIVYTHMILPDTKKQYSYIHFKQKNMINILNTLRVPIKSEAIMYISKYHNLIRYIYMIVEKHYKEQNITMTRLNEKIIDFPTYGDGVIFASHSIKL